MVGTAVLCSLYGMYWDGDAGIVYINYVPGGGYAWMVGWLLVMISLFVLFLVRQRLHVLVLLLVAALYWLFFLSIPLVGYAWFFSWRFVDVIAGADYSTPAAIALPPPPFSALAESSLGLPFAVCVYLGCACGLAGFTLSSAQFVRHLH